MSEGGRIEGAKTYCNLNEESTINLIKKDLRSLAGIYASKHNISGKMYIGSSISLWGRFKEHLNNRHSNIHLQRAFTKYGLEQFSFSVLEFCASDELIRLEQKYIDMVSNKYNICHTAGSTLGCKHTEESKAKIGAAGLGRTFSEETMTKFRARKHSEETLVKFRARKQTKDTRKQN